MYFFSIKQPLASWCYFPTLVCMYIDGCEFLQKKFSTSPSQKIQQNIYYMKKQQEAATCNSYKRILLIFAREVLFCQIQTVH